MTIEEKYKRAITALQAAKRVIDYCGGGDAWERECNEKDMGIFYSICEELEVER